MKATLQNPNPTVHAIVVTAEPMLCPFAQSLKAKNEDGLAALKLMSSN
jgi:hypothetical protein